MTCPAQWTKMSSCINSSFKRPNDHAQTRKWWGFYRKWVFRNIVFASECLFGSLLLANVAEDRSNDFEVRLLMGQWSSKKRFAGRCRRLSHAATSCVWGGRWRWRGWRCFFCSNQAQIQIEALHDTADLCRQLKRNIWCVCIYMCVCVVTRRLEKT